jgi:hypothetical protein
LDNQSVSRLLAEIREIHFRAQPATIEADLARAIAILKSMESEDARQRADVYMEGLSQTGGSGSAEGRW